MGPKELAEILKGLIPFKAEYTSAKKHLIIDLRKEEFEICRPVTKEKSEYLGLKKRLFLIHRTMEGMWDIKVL